MAEKKAPSSKSEKPAEVEEEGKPLSFEEGLQQLELIVKEMEGGDLPLDHALDLFERGTRLSDICRKQLESAETRVEVLTRRAGEMQPQPFDEDLD